MTDDQPSLMLLFFSSPQSGPSRRMESLLAHIARKERERLKIVQVDVDAKRDLAERFDVAAAPTLVLVHEKRTVARLEGRVSAPMIEAMLEPYLEPALTV